MTLLVGTISKETKTLMDNNIRLESIGDMDALPSKCRRELLEAKKKTEGNTRMTLVLALSYSARWELKEAMKAIAVKVKSGVLEPEKITEEIIAQHLSTKGMPDPELLIRTSGEHRISNFLLWQISYAELYFTDKLWPDFRKEDLYDAIVSYQRRERRFGKTSEQLSA
jgi:undecaprenyl diphosphate synthase